MHTDSRETFGSAYRWHRYEGMRRFHAFRATVIEFFGPVHYN